MQQSMNTFIGLQSVVTAVCGMDHNLSDKSADINCNKQQYCEDWCLEQKSYSLTRSIAATQDWCMWHQSVSDEVLLKKLQGEVR